MALDLSVKEGRRLEKAVTSGGPAEIVREQTPGKTTISAGHFETVFNDQNRPCLFMERPMRKLLTRFPASRTEFLHRAS